jgi:uncharacterized membrane protein YuzA (DUF378 family)
MFNNRILFYGFLCFLWLAMAVAISLGLHERFLGEADEWKKYLAIGICALMCCFNLLRIYLIRKADERLKRSSHGTQ